MIFSSPLMAKDTTAQNLQKFKSVCVTSDYACGILDKAIKKLKPQAGFSNELPDDPEAVALMSDLLRINPDNRMTADEAIKHDYVVKFYNPAVEDQVQRRTVVPPLDDDTQLSIDEYRSKVYEIVQVDKAR